MKHITILFLMLFCAGFTSQGFCVPLTSQTGIIGEEIAKTIGAAGAVSANGATSAPISTTRNVSTTYLDSAGSALNNVGQVVTPNEHIAQPTMPSNLSNMAQVTTFLSNPSNNCSLSNPPDTCFVALTASSGATTTNNAPICPQGYQLLFSTGSYVMDSSGHQMNWTGSFSQTNVSAEQIIFYNLVANGFSCSVSSTYTDVGNVPIDGNKNGSPCGWFCVNSANQPSVSQFETTSGNYNVGQYVSYNGHNGILINVTNNSYSCYTGGGVPAHNSSCSSVAGAYWETHSLGTFQSYTCSRSAGFYYDGNISNPNNFPMPSAQALPYTSPTVSICGKLKYSTDWQH